MGLTKYWWICSINDIVPAQTMASSCSNNNIFTQSTTFCCLNKNDIFHLNNGIFPCSIGNFLTGTISTFADTTINWHFCHHNLLACPLPQHTFHGCLHISYGCLHTSHGCLYTSHGCLYTSHGWLLAQLSQLLAHLPQCLNISALLLLMDFNLFAISKHQLLPSPTWLTAICCH